MDNKKDIFVILKEYPEKQEVSDKVLVGTKELIEEHYGEKAKAKSKKNPFGLNQW